MSVKLLPIALILLALIFGLIFYSIYGGRLSKEKQPEITQPPAGGQTTTTQLGVSVKTAPGYKSVTEKPTGWFRTGQEADMILYATGFGESGGPLVLNHPGKVAIDGKRLIVSDTRNNRVLVWNEIPTMNNTPPDLVLGQPNFESNAGRLGRDGMNWPMGVATDGKKLLVGDANNDRVLIWNEFPTSNNQLPDLVLGAPDFNTWPNDVGGGCERDPRTRIYWPWAIWTDGKKLIVGSTGGGGTLVWNEFPTKNNQPADILLGAENFSARFADTPNHDPLVRFPSPRSIASDGERLVLGTYHPHEAYFYSKFPNKSGEPADFSMPFIEWGVMGLSLNDGRLFAAIAHKIYLWNAFPENNGTKPDLKLGTEETYENILSSPDKRLFFPNTFNFPYDVASDGRRLIIADTGNNRVLIYNKIPSNIGEGADVILGKPEIFQSRNSFGSGPAPFSDGKRLAVGVDGIGVWLYDKLPDESKAPADTVVGAMKNKTVAGGHTVIAGDRLIMAHRESSKIFIWNEVPKNDNQSPDVVLGLSEQLDRGESGSGRTGLNGPVSVATGGMRLFVSDHGNNRVLMWNNIPTANQTPADAVLGQPDFDSVLPGNDLNRLDRPVQTSTDGKRLVAVDQNNNRLLVWKKLPANNGQPADFEIKVTNHSAGVGCAGIPQYARLALPSGVYVYNNSLFVTDNGNNRVLVWSRFPESGYDEPDVVLGQKDFMSNYPSNTKGGLFLPAQISFDGSFLWVGETKWSERLLRFSVQAK